MASITLKNLFQKNLNKEISNEKKSSDKEESNNYQNNRRIKITYEEWGFNSAGKFSGRKLAFLGSLNLVKEHYRKEERENEEKRNLEVSKAKNEVEKRELEINQKNEKITSNINSFIKPIKEKIENLKKEIIKIKEDPKSVMPDKTSKVSFTIGLTILIILTIYLIIFYSSASYSALFKKFELDDIGLANSIFDPKAIETAFKTSTTELTLILTIPFVFLGLGFLIHKFQEQKGNTKYLKIGLLMIITFVFDSILAYEITEKIYDIKKGNSFQNMPDYNMSLAFNSVNFWLIIFAGFVVYLIWGFVFDFTMETYDKLNFVKQAIKAKETEIKIYEEDILNKNNDNDILNQEINKLNLEIVDFKKIVDGDTVIYNWADFEKVVREFALGWGHWMNANLIEKIFIDEIHTSTDDFLKIGEKNLSSEILTNKN